MMIIGNSQKFEDKKVLLPDYLKSKDDQLKNTSEQYFDITIVNDLEVGKHGSFYLNDLSTYITNKQKNPYSVSFTFYYQQK